MSRREPSADARPLGWLMMKAASSLALRLGRAFSEAGVRISPEQYGVLACAARSPGSSQADVARALGRDAPSLTRLADALERGGFLVKEASADDRRAYRLVLTAAGKEALAAAERVVAREESFIESTIEGGSKDLVAGAMRRLIEACAAER